jgi:hypothetical protein
VILALNIAPLLYAVVPIVLGCPDKQVVRINATSVIALMKHHHSFGNLSTMKTPGRSVRSNFVCIRHKLK